MDSTEFSRWLQGFCELQEDDTPPTEKQWCLIKQHLQLVFFKITDDIELVSEDQVAGLETLQTMLQNYNKEFDIQGKKKSVAFCKPAPSNKICSSTKNER